MVEDTYVKPAGKRSFTVMFVAAIGPLFVNITVNITVSPKPGVGLFTLFVITKSAVFGVTVALAVLFAGLVSVWSLANNSAELVLVPLVVAFVVIFNVTLVIHSPKHLQPKFPYRYCMSRYRRLIHMSGLQVIGLLPLHLSRYAEVHCLLL